MRLEAKNRRAEEKMTSRKEGRASERGRSGMAERTGKLEGRQQCKELTKEKEK